MTRPNLDALIQLFEQTYNPELNFVMDRRLVSRYNSAQERISDKWLGRAFLYAVRDVLGRSREISDISIIVHNDLGGDASVAQLRRAGYDMRAITDGARSRLHALEIKYTTTTGRVHVLMDLGGINGVALGQTVATECNEAPQMRWQSHSRVTPSKKSEFVAKENEIIICMARDMYPVVGDGKFSCRYGGCVSEVKLEGDAGVSRTFRRDVFVQLQQQLSELRVPQHLNADRARKIGEYYMNVDYSQTDLDDLRRLVADKLKAFQPPQYTDAEDAHEEDANESCCWSFLSSCALFCLGGAASEREKLLDARVTHAQYKH